MEEYRSVLKKILEIIEFQDDDGQFVTSFMNLVYKQALVTLSENFGEIEREPFMKELSSKGNQEEALAFLKSKFSQEQIDFAIKNSADHLFTSYIEDISGDLNEDQSKRLVQLLEASASRNSVGSN